MSTSFNNKAIHQAGEFLGDLTGAVTDKKVLLMPKVLSYKGGDEDDDLSNAS